VIIAHSHVWGNHSLAAVTSSYCWSMRGGLPVRPCLYPPLDVSYILAAASPRHLWTIVHEHVVLYVGAQVYGKEDCDLSDETTECRDTLGILW